MATIGFIIVGETCGGCGKPWAECECLKNAIMNTASTSITGDIYAWDFWDNDEDAVYDETP